MSGLNFVSLLYQASDLALPIGAELVQKTGAVWNAKTQQTTYQSAFAKNEYLGQLLRVAH